ncbi:DNA repair exonuclease [Metabacillus sp. KIGAM252]|uniref:DNA repair exonuclease n=1 Tax=Metabacillus flavus TaxID=2823519 RepID=A0ABS5LBY7_9BACI|nr:DNA repair exonuclease [Metabacillus flavus]MBS2968244.1 DNA repair exonuclease [Metabacillus flavus]
MPPIKFIHAADLHLDSPFAGLNHLPESILHRLKESTFASFSNLVSFTIEEKADFLLLAGDLFDGENRSLKAQLRLKREFEKLNEFGIPVYVIHGNHDHLGGKWLQIEWPQNVHVFSHEQVECLPFYKNKELAAHLYGYSYPERSVTKNLTSHYIKQSGAPFNIGLLHGSLEGGTEEHDVYSPFTIRELESAGFDYWALGHIHKRAILPSHETTIVYPGNLQGRHRKETGEKGCYTVTINEPGVNTAFSPLHDVLWLERTIILDETETADQLLELIKTEKEALRKEGCPVILTINLSGKTQLAADLKRAETAIDLLAAINEGEEDRREFVWTGKITDNTVIHADKEKLKQDSVFYRDFLNVTEQYESFAEAAAPLYGNALVRKYLEAFSEEEQQEMIREAESLVLAELLKEGELHK